MRSLGNKCWGEECLIRLELGKVAEEKQMEWEAAVLDDWDEERKRTHGLKDLTNWLVPKVKIMEAVVVSIDELGIVHGGLECFQQR